MKKNGFLKAALFLTLFTVLAAGVPAQVTVSGGFALSTMSAKIRNDSFSGEIGFGGNIYADYLLPISVPLSLGFEVGYDRASLEDIDGYVIPLLFRAAYHFDFMANLDLYLVGKLGYALGGGKTGNESMSGFNGIGFGFDVGASYYFNPRIGVFAEAGFDRYNLKKDVSWDDGNYTIKIPFTRFLTVGISVKF